MSNASAVKTGLMCLTLRRLCGRQIDMQRDMPGGLKEFGGPNELGGGFPGCFALLQTTDVLVENWDF